jgi:hypothetical protein
MGSGKAPKQKEDVYGPALTSMANMEMVGAFPIRQAFQQDFYNMRDPNFNINDIPQISRMNDLQDYTYAMGRPQMEGQYNQAKENIMGSSPAGGALTSALARLESDRAGKVGQLGMAVEQQKALKQQSLMDEIMNRQFGATGALPGQVMGSLGGLSQGINGYNSAASQFKSPDLLSQLSQGMGLATDAAAAGLVGAGLAGVGPLAALFS